MRTKRVHIVGCYRSGTTLLMELMWRGFRFSGRADHEASLFDPIPNGETLYLSKKPPDTPHIERAFLQDRELFLIAMLRDPRAVVSSRHESRPGLYFRSFHHWRACAETIRRLDALEEPSVKDCEGFASRSKNVGGMLGPIRKIADEPNVVVGHPRFLLVRFEDLLIEPDAVQRRIERQFGFLERRGRFSDYPNGIQTGEAALRSLGGTRRLDPARIEGWRNHLPRVKAQLIAHPDLIASLVEFGYESSANWTSVLEGVEPGGLGHKDEAPSRLRQWKTAWRYRHRTKRYLEQRHVGA